MSIHEAAERLRKYNAARTPEARRDVYYGTPFILQADERTVALEYLRLTNPSPITPEALAARGFVEQGEDSWQRNCQDADIDVYFSGDVPHVNLDDGNRIYLPHITTLSQLDHLLAALTPINKGE